MNVCGPQEAIAQYCPTASHFGIVKEVMTFDHSHPLSLAQETRADVCSGFLCGYMIDWVYSSHIRSRAQPPLVKTRATGPPETSTGRQPLQCTEFINPPYPCFCDTLSLERRGRKGQRGVFVCLQLVFLQDYLPCGQQPFDWPQTNISLSFAVLSRFLATLRSPGVPLYTSASTDRVGDNTEPD